MRAIKIPHNQLIDNMLRMCDIFNVLIIRVLCVVENKNVKIFAKILQKNLEVKKKSVSLQPI